MIPNDKEIKELESKLSGKISAYKKTHGNALPASYFNTIYLRATEELASKKRMGHEKPFNYKLVNAFLFLIIFVASYNIFNFTDTGKINIAENDYLFESSFPWLDDEYFADVTIDNEITFDYNNYLEQEPELFGYIETMELIDNLPEDELNEIYNNIKYTKM